MVEDRSFFCSVLAAAVAPHLVKMDLLTMGDGIDQLVDLCNQKQKSWATYKLLVKKGESMEDWLFLNAAREISGSSNPVFLTLMVDRLTERFGILHSALKVAYA